MKKKYILQRKIDKWLRVHDIYRKKIAKKAFAKILKIDSHSINFIDAGNGCINLFTSGYFYKIQLYGNNIRKELENRKLFLGYAKTVLSPISIHRRMGLTTIRMPVLEQPFDNEKSACYILKKLRKVGHKTEFKINDYPLLVDGLDIIQKCGYGIQLSKKLRKYLQVQEGKDVWVGIVHGDFHRGNIMCKGNKPVLIDFDCSRKNDIQSVDALYYILEEERHKHGYKKTWLEEWLLICKNVNTIYEHECIAQVDVDIKFGLIILLLERIAQEQQNGYLLIKANMDVVKRIGWAINIWAK